MKHKFLFLFVLSLAAIAAILGCHVGGNAPFAPNNGETHILPETRVVDANGRFTDITFLSGAVIKCPKDNTFKEGVKVTAFEQKIPVITDNSGKFSYIYVYNISAVLPAENSLSSDVPVNTVEKPLSVTLLNNSTAGTCYIGTRVSENEPWRYSLVTDGNASNARFMRLSAKPPKTCAFDLYRLNVQFRLFAFDNEDSDKGEVDSVALSTVFEDNKITVKDGKYTEDLEIKITLNGEKLDSINADNLIARIIYRTSNLNPAQLKANGSIVKQTDSDDKAVTGGYEHSFEIPNITVDSQMSGEAVLSFVLNLNGVSLEDFPTDFLVEFYSDTKDEKALPFIYTQTFSFETKEPEPEPVMTYTITYDLDGGQMTKDNPENYTVETETFTLNNPTRDGYTFTGWTGSNGNTPQTTVEIAKGTTGDLTFTANWSENPPDTYTLAFVAGKGIASVGENKAYKAGESITLNCTVKEGYEFVNWTDSNGDTVTSPFTMPEKEVTLTANAKTIAYNIAFELDGGQLTSDNPKNYTVETADFNLPTPTKDYYNFLGWSLNKGEPVTPVTIAQGTHEDRTYTAKYAPSTFTITLAGCDDATVDYTSTDYNIETETFNLPKPTKDYYSFNGWVLNGGDPVENVTIIQGTHEDRTYTANWSINSYNLTINKGTGIATVSGAGSHEYNSNVTASCTMKAGYEFANWTGDIATDSFKMPAQNATMTANAKPIEYKISYITEGGVFAEGVASPTLYTVASEAFTLPTPTKNNCEFVGWVINGGAPVKSVTIAQGTHENRTYVASWTLAEVLKFNLSDSVVLELRRCPDGTFDMGSTNGCDDEKPVHHVTISKDFFLGTFEVTNAQYTAIMGGNTPSQKNTGADFPVENVSWNDIMTDSSGFIAKLNASLTAQLPIGYKFDLPTEAQWEYVCRAGSSGDYSKDKDDNEVTASNLVDYAWYSDNSSNTTHTVGTKAPNKWGFYDMHGNVWELCKDMYGDYPTTAVTDPFCDSGSYSIDRGGSWSSSASGCRSAYRGGVKPDYVVIDIGFRLALVPVE